MWRSKGRKLKLFIDSLNVCNFKVFCGEDTVDPLPGIDPPDDEYVYDDEECDDIFDDCEQDCLSINEIDDTIFNR